MRWSQSNEIPKNKIVPPIDETATDVDLPVRSIAGIYKIHTLCLEEDSINEAFQGEIAFMPDGWNSGKKNLGIVRLPDGREGIWFRVFGDPDSFVGSFVKNGDEITELLFDDYPSHQTGGVLLIPVAKEIVDMPEPIENDAIAHHEWSARLANTVELSDGEAGFNDNKLYLGDVSIAVNYAVAE